MYKKQEIKEALKSKDRKRVSSIESQDMAARGGKLSAFQRPDPVTIPTEDHTRGNLFTAVSKAADAMTEAHSKELIRLINAVTETHAEHGDALLVPTASVSDMRDPLHYSPKPKTVAGTLIEILNAAQDAARDGYTAPAERVPLEKFAEMVQAPTDAVIVEMRRVGALVYVSGVPAYVDTVQLLTKCPPLSNQARHKGQITATQQQNDMVTNSFYSIHEAEGQQANAPKDDKTARAIHTATVLGAARTDAAREREALASRQVEGGNIHHILHFRKWWNSALVSSMNTQLNNAR